MKKEYTQGIHATNMSVTKDHNKILRDVTFLIEPGMLTGLIGPSGAGKTTIMRCIIGAQRVTSGKLIVNGLSAGDATLRRRTGYVTQDPSVYEDLTVEQNLRYFGILASADKQGVDDVIHHVDLWPQRHQLIETLSGGQRARVSLAVALLGDPSVLVLDEPTVGLDPLLRRSLWALFRELAEQGKTIIISSHVMDEAELCDNIVLVRDGKLLWSKGKQALLKETGTKTVEDAFLARIEGSK
jgi:ABC-2 type transport system ATP-binding protein